MQIRILITILASTVLAACDVGVKVEHSEGEASVNPNRGQVSKLSDPVGLCSDNKEFISSQESLLQNNGYTPVKTEMNGQYCIHLSKSDAKAASAIPGVIFGDGDT